MKKFIYFFWTQCHLKQISYEHSIHPAPVLHDHPKSLVALFPSFLYEEIKLEKLLGIKRDIYEDV